MAVCAQTHNKLQPQQVHATITIAKATLKTIWGKKHNSKTKQKCLQTIRFARKMSKQMNERGTETKPNVKKRIKTALKCSESPHTHTTITDQK